MQYLFLLFVLGVPIFEEEESIKTLTILDLINDVNEQNILSQMQKVNRE